MQTADNFVSSIQDFFKARINSLRMEIEKLHGIGESLGLKGEELKNFITEERKIAKQERDEERERRAEERERVRSEVELTQLKLNLERERQRDRDENCESQVKTRPPKLPIFDEGKDNLDTYLNRFERYASANEWPLNTWATNLSALLSGKALDTYARLSDSEALDYNTLKDALLKRYDLTSEGFRRKLRSAKPEAGETAQQFIHRMRGYLGKWLKLGGYKEEYDDLIEIILVEQFHKSCSKELSMFIRESLPSSLLDLAKIADRYKEAHSGWHLSPPVKNNVYERKLPNGSYSKFQSVGRQQSAVNKPTATRAPDSLRSPGNATRSCFICGRTGHLAQGCNQRKKLVASLLMDGDVEETSGQGHPPSMRTESDEEEASPQGPKELRSHLPADDTSLPDAQVSAQEYEHGCLLIDSCFSCDKVMQPGLRDKDINIPTLSAVCGAKPIRKMPVAEGQVNGIPVQVLRDSGCSTAVIQTRLVRQEQLTGEWRTCILIDGTTRKFQVARVSVDTPYFIGELDVLCMKNPVYPLILGNVAGVRSPGDPDTKWKPTELLDAVETRHQRKEATKPLRALKVPSPISDVSPDEFRQEQENDPTLDIVRRYVSSGEVKESRNGSKSKFKVKDRLLYR